ncbi:hypothetical protein ACCS66_35520 [Rhizobium ruizarguesonis]
MTADARVDRDKLGGKTMNGEEDLTDDERKLIGDLKEKIKAKMDVAKTLGAFVTGVLLAIIAIVGDTNKLGDVLGEKKCQVCIVSWPDVSNVYKYVFFVAIVSTAVSVVLFFCTMYAYDRLLMPRYFWTKRHSVELLYVAMSKAWNRLFNGAIFALAVGLGSFVFVLIRMGLLEILLLVLGVASAVVYSLWAVPRIKFR